MKKDKSFYYYKDGDKVTKTGWISTGDCKLYVTAKSGKLATGFKKLDGKYYYFSDKAKLMTNCWKTIGGTQYYLCSDGHAAMKEIVAVDGKKYYFRENATHVRSADEWNPPDAFEKCTLEDIIVNTGFDSIRIYGNYMTGKNENSGITAEVFMNDAGVPIRFKQSYYLEYDKWISRLESEYDLDYELNNNGLSSSLEIVNSPDYPFSATYKSEYTDIENEFDQFFFYYDYEDQIYSMYWRLN